MTRIYLAGPFFSDAQIARIEKVEQALTANPTVDNFFSPRQSDENDPSTTLEIGSPAWAKQIFEKDVIEIDHADAIVAVADFAHANVDSGTAFEIGYAYKANKPIIILQELDEPLNLMLGQASHYYTKSIDELATYDFKQLPANQFNGQTF